MVWTHAAGGDIRGRAYLVERYVPPTTAGELVVSTARVADMCRDTDADGDGVAYLYSAYLPTEDTCFCLFGAASAAAVRALNERAGFTFDRITDAHLLLGVHAAAPSSRRPS